MGVKERTAEGCIVIFNDSNGKPILDSNGKPRTLFVPYRTAVMVWKDLRVRCLTLVEHPCETRKRGCLPKPQRQRQSRRIQPRPAEPKPSSSSEEPWDGVG